MEERVYQGFVYRRNAPGEPWQRVGPAPDAPQSAPGGGIVIGTPRADPVPAGYQRNPDGSVTYIPGGPADPAVIARNSAMSRAPEKPNEPNLPQGYMMGPDGRAMPIPGLPPTAVGGNSAVNAASDPQRVANLRALERQIANVRQQYEQNFRGGAPNQLTNWLPNIIRPENSQFESAAAGMADTGNAAFRIPGVGAQSDADAARFVAANTPGPGDTDAQIEQKLNNLSIRLEETYRAMGLGPGGVPLGQAPQAPQRDQQAAGVAIPTGGAGGPPSGPVDPFGQGGPAVLPQARGARADAGIGANGVTGEAGGMRVIPELYGLGNEIAGLIQQGATREQVLAHYQSRMQQAGAPISMQQVQVINEVVQKHQQFPNAPVSSLADGWDNFHMQPTGGSIIGRAADTNLGAGIINAANAISIGGLRGLGNDQTRAVMDYTQAERPISSALGDAVGSAIVMAAGGELLPAGSMLARGGGIGLDMAYGGVRGAVETPGTLSDRALGAAMGVGATGAGNLAGRGVMGVAGRAVRGVSDPSVQYLADRGIRLTPGQMLGGGENRGMFGRGIRAMENAMESSPIFGQSIVNRRAEGVGDYARAQLAENLAPIGYRPPAGPFSQDMLGDAQRAVGDSYNFLQSRSFSADPAEMANINSIVQSGRTVPRVGDEFGYIYDNNIRPMFDAGNNFTGQGYQDALQQLRSAGSGFSRDGAMGNAASGVTSQLEDALNGIVARQAPDVAPQMQAANRAYAGLVPIENAAITAANNDGLFTPAQYGRAATNNTRRFGGRAAAARGDFPGSQLQQAAERVLPLIVPNSGTTDRALATLAAPVLLGGGASGLSAITGVGDPKQAALLGLPAVAYTGIGRRALQSALIGGSRRRAVGDYIYNNRNVGGLLGASLALPAAL